MKIYLNSIDGIPDFFDGKMIGELKSVNTHQFRKMTRHPSAWKQCQWYMRLCIENAKETGTEIHLCPIDMGKGRPNTDHNSRSAI